MEAKIIFTQIDTDGSGGLDKEEFISALKVRFRATKMAFVEVLLVLAGVGHGGRRYRRHVQHF